MNKGVIIAIGVGIIIVAISVGLLQDTSISESPILETSEETIETEGQSVKVHISDSATASDKSP